MSKSALAFQGAVESFQAGRLQQALEVCRSILEQNPREPGAHRLLGLIALRMGNLAVGVECLSRAVSLQPDEPGNLIDLSIALQMNGKVETALALLTAATARFPGQAPILERYGELLELSGQREAALHTYLQACRAVPDSFVAHNNAANLLNNEGRFAEAEGRARRALELRPQATEAANNLGNSLQGQGQSAAACEAYRRALENDPRNANAAYNLGLVWESRSCPVRAIQCYRKALEMLPDLVAAHNNLGVMLLTAGDGEAARRELAIALKSNRDDDAIRSNFLLAHQYAPDIEPATLRRLHAEWAPPNRAPQAQAPNESGSVESGSEESGAARSPAPLPFRNPFHRGRALRVGFVSGDFGRHPVGYFLAPILERLRQRDLFTACYSNCQDHDDVTQRIIAATNGWRNIFRQSDEHVLSQIDGDEIDVLIDLSGHTGRNRLPLFARRAAPVQATWLGYVGTTGVTQMDYLICDRYHVPAELAGFHTEQPLRMAEGYVCFEPPADSPSVSALPAAKSGCVTFGCFNNPAKINSKLAAVWSRILAAIPGSRLLLKYRGLDESSIQAHLGRMLSDQGIAADRVTFLGGGARDEMLASYHGVDLALDTAPYSGGLTTCEALWMGVPVLTCAGGTFASRHSLSHLSNTGFTGTIASNPEHLVRLAVEWAGDLGRLAAARATLRDRMLASPLCNADLFASDMARRLELVVRKPMPTRSASEGLRCFALAEAS